MNDVRFAVVVLGGGSATRFPCKLDATFGGISLLELVVRNLRPLGDECVLSIADEASLGRARQLGIAAVVDDFPDRGPLGGALSAAAYVHASWLLVAPGDTPLVDAAFVLTLWAARAEHQAVVARDPSGRVHPLPAFYRRDALVEHAPRVFAANRRSFRALLERLDVKIVDVNDARPLTNVNTPGELERLRRETDGTTRAIGE